MDEREVEIVDLTGDENPPPRQDRFGPQYPVATERSLGKRPPEPSSWEPLPKVRRAGYQNEQPPPGPSMSHGTVRQKMMTPPLEAGKRLHEKARNDRSLREAMDALVAGTATAWQQALFERTYNEIMTQSAPMPSLPPPHHLSSMRDKSMDRLLSVDGLVKCVLQQADGPAPNTPYGPQAQCVIDRLCFDLPRALFEKLRNREYGFPGLDREVEEYDHAVESARRAVNSSWPGREPIPYTSAVETALAERYQQSKQTLKTPWAELSHIETDSLDQAILPKSLKLIVRRAIVRSEYWEELNNAEFIRQIELRYRLEPEHNAILFATAQGFNLEHPSLDRLLESTHFHTSVIPGAGGIIEISKTPLSEAPSSWSWTQPMRPETGRLAAPSLRPWPQDDRCPVTRFDGRFDEYSYMRPSTIADYVLGLSRQDHRLCLDCVLCILAQRVKDEPALRKHFTDVTMGATGFVARRGYNNAVSKTVNYLRQFCGQKIPEFRKWTFDEDTHGESLQRNNSVSGSLEKGRTDEESSSKQPIEPAESSSSATSSQNLSERSSEPRSAEGEDVVEPHRPAQQSPTNTEDVREGQTDKSPEDIDELSNEDLQILATRIRITRSMSSFTSSDPIVRELVVHANAEAGFAQTLEQVAQGNDNTSTKRTPLETFRQAIKAIKQDVERPPAMRGLPEPLSSEQWPLKVSPQHTIYMKRSTEHGHRIPFDKRPTKYLAHPDSFIQMHCYPLTLLPKATWNALHNNKPHGAVCARCRRPRHLSPHDRKLFLTAERLSWPRQTYGYKARTGIEEALWPVNFELGVEEPVQFSIHHDIFSAKKSFKNRNFPYSDSSEADMVMRVVEHAEILTDASWELRRELDQEATPMLSQSSTNHSTAPSSARPPLSEIDGNTRPQQTPLTLPSSATKHSKALEAASDSSPMSLVEMYSSLDQIERSSPLASRFLEAYAEKLHGEVCRECWVETDVGGDDDGSEGVESEDEGEDEGEKARLDVW
ncbi:hypothetical protein KC332_g14899 [Hortaea werneckii]|uniref:Uncharacterized protein n=1 Tax=Hortaea werneckii TaxID=91943 RepID=A0A3M7IHP9_HORWE|nr:hypothetical protein KC358_g14935 [Hortaea werneckii]KAI6805312.1 hypothetical protein KC350_g14640 [Hortaea werneckii]KAI6923460.1 hypothetical protein KC341_g14722 [Hortaea werneckii]KAI6940024.1 hypothetical protein KC348_g5112 [Hortaea werneckii]KAI6953571.1 hypothetical protein KC321_g16882 [Hortaea werneckii]